MTDREVTLTTGALFGVGLVALHVEGYTVDRAVLLLIGCALLLVLLVVCAVRVATAE